MVSGRALYILIYTDSDICRCLYNHECTKYIHRHQSDPSDSITNPHELFSGTARTKEKANATSVTIVYVRANAPLRICVPTWDAKKTEPRRIPPCVYERWILPVLPYRLIDFSRLVEHFIPGLEGWDGDVRDITSCPEFKVFDHVSVRPHVY